MATNLTKNWCLADCNRHGSCFYQNNSLLCNCEQFYEGNECELDLKPCSNVQCLNYAKCIQNLTDMSYKCNCSEYFKGKNCEEKIDLCQNETCSSNGVCYEENFVPKCKCFSMISGEKCEIKSEERKVIETTIKATSIIAIVILIATYAIFVLNDVFNKFYWKKFNNKKNKSKRANKNPKV